MCPISQEVKATRQCNLVSQYSVTRKIFFLKNHAQNVVEAERSVPGPIIKKHWGISLDQHSEMLPSLLLLW